MSDGYGDSGGVHWWPRCWRCNRALAEYLSPPFSLKCPRCHAQNTEGPAQVQSPSSARIAKTS